jgi:hypothetical protein
MLATMTFAGAALWCRPVNRISTRLGGYELKAHDDECNGEGDGGGG